MFKFFTAISVLIGTVISFVMYFFQIAVTLIKQVYSSFMFLIVVVQSMTVPFLAPTLFILMSFSVFLFIMHRGN